MSKSRITLEMGVLLGLLLCFSANASIPLWFALLL